MSTLEEVLLSREQSRRDNEELFRKNAEMRHGIPKGDRHPFDPRAVSPGASDNPPSPPPVARQPQQQAPIQQVQAKKGWKDYILPIVLGAGLTGGGMSLYQYWNQEVIQEPAKESLFQYLEDHGFHIPKEGDF